MEKNKLQILCPECGHQFSPEKALEGHLKQHFEKEYADKLAVKVKEAADRAMISTQEEFKAKFEALQAEAQQKAQKLKELEGKSVALAQKERELSEREERA